MVERVFNRTARVRRSGSRPFALVSRSLVYRLVARYRQRAQPSSLLSVPRGRTERTPRLDKEVETLIRSAVERSLFPWIWIFLTPEKRFRFHSECTHGSPLQ